MINLKLKDIAISQTGPFGSQLHESDYVEIGTPIVTVEHLGETGFSHQNLPLVSDTDKVRLNKYLLKEGDIVFSRVGSVDRNTYVSKSEDGWLFSGRCIRVRVDKMKADPKFISFYFRQRTFKEMMLNISVGATMPSLNTSLMDNIPLRLPELETQQKIAKVLSDLDAKIELNNRINAELEAMSKLVYEYWFVQFDFPVVILSAGAERSRSRVEGYKSSGGKMVWNEELKQEIPEGWVSCKLGDIIKKTGTGLNPRDNFKLGEGNNYYVTIKNIEQGKVLLDDKCDKISDEALMIIDKRSDLQAGDILYTSIEPVGTTYLIKEKPTNWNINESVFTIRPDLSKVSSEFLYMFLSGDYIKAYTRNVSAGSIHKGVRHSTLKDCSLVLPDYKTIARFTKVVSPMLDKQNEITKQNQELSSLRDWLLPMLMNGQVSVAEAEERVEEELGMVAEREREKYGND